MSYELEHEINQLHAEICAGLADPKRILILYALSDKPSTVSELVNLLELSQPMISRHLKILRQRGMVNSNRIGTSIKYSLSDSRLIEALNLLRAVLASNLRSQAALADTVDETQTHPNQPGEIE